MSVMYRWSSTSYCESEAEHKVPTKSASRQQRWCRNASHSQRVHRKHTYVCAVCMYVCAASSTEIVTVIEVHSDFTSHMPFYMQGIWSSPTDHLSPFCSVLCRHFHLYWAEPETCWICIFFYALRDRKTEVESWTSVRLLESCLFLSFITPRLLF